MTEIDPNHAPRKSWYCPKNGEKVICAECGGPTIHRFERYARPISRPRCDFHNLDLVAR